MVQAESWVPSQDIVCVGFVVIRSTLCVKLTTCLQLVLKLRMFGARHTLPLCAFMACIETTLSFTSSIIDSTSSILGLNPGPLTEKLLANCLNCSMAKKGAWCSIQQFAAREQVWICSLTLLFVYSTGTTRSHQNRQGVEVFYFPDENHPLPSKPLNDSELYEAMDDEDDWEKDFCIVDKEAGSGIMVIYCFSNTELSDPFL